MASGPANKRKRPERGASNDEDSSRPSPHKPETLQMAQHSERGKGGAGKKQNRPASQNSAGAPNTASAIPTQATSPPQGRGTPAIESSQPSTPMQSAQQFPQKTEGKVNPSSTIYYAYEYLVDEHVGAWQDNGKHAVLESSKDGDYIVVQTIAEELVCSVLSGRLDASDAGSTAADMIRQHDTSDLDISSIFLDTISLLPFSEAHNRVLSQFIAATNIDPDIIRVNLEDEKLVSLGLVRKTFQRVKARKTTTALYKQANFNLLREETEGYAKLITEYFTTAQQAIASTDPNIAEPAFQRLMALVGAFDLDVGRVMDVLIDVSANSLARAFPFVLKFYRVSGWWPNGGDDMGGLDLEIEEDLAYRSLPAWAEPQSGIVDPADVQEQHSAEMAEIRKTRDRKFWDRVKVSGMDAFYEIGARKIVDYDAMKHLLEAEIPAEYDTKGNEINGDKRKRLNENRKYMLETKTLPPPGNSDAAQLFGFKLRFYVSKARAESDAMPENLISLAALLIKVGFISLRDIYPHLHPSDEEMPSERERLEKEKAEREYKERGIGSNALATSGALTDDTIPVIRNVRASGNNSASGASTPKPEAEVEKEELPTLENQKIPMLKALLLIGALPEALFILGKFPWVLEVDPTIPPLLHRIANVMLSNIGEMLRPIPASDSGLLAGKRVLVDTSATSDGILPTVELAKPKPPRWLHADSQEERRSYYYPDWTDNIPVCQTVDDVFLLCGTFLGFLGVKVGQNTSLYANLLRLAKHSLQSDSSAANKSRWLDLMRRVLVPALSLTNNNAGLSLQVYELLMLFPIGVRYNIYAEWYTGRTSRNPDVMKASKRNQREVKDVLKRVSNKSGRIEARALGKVCLSSPGVALQVLLNQLESYSNAVPSYVESTRYFSLLAHDILNWRLITSLNGGGKNSRQDDGMFISRWLIALSTFVGTMFARFNVNIDPVLQYITSELRKGNIAHHAILQEIVFLMSGVKADTSILSDAHTSGMAGGDAMQMVTLKQVGDRRSSTFKESRRMMKALVETKLAGQILVILAQERTMHSNRDENKFAPLKVISSSVDMIQHSFAQYHEMLKVKLPIQIFETEVPSVLELVSDFGILPNIALTIWRHILAHKVATFDTGKENEGGDQMKGIVAHNKTATNDVEMADDETGLPPNPKEQSPPNEKNTNSPASEKTPWHPALRPIIDGLSAKAPQLQESTSIPFYVTFWTLALPDVQITANYKPEAARLRAEAKTLSKSIGPKTESLEIKRIGRDVSVMEELANKLDKEHTTQTGSYVRTSNRIKAETEHYFDRRMERGELDKRHQSLLQDCFLPRAMMSTVDAHYCFLMLKTLHSLATPGFSTMHLLNHLFQRNKLAAILHACTMDEAQNLGRFLRDVLRLLQSWHADKATYETQAFGNKRQLPGFAKKLDAKGHPENLLDFEDFRRLMFNWHSHLNGAFKLCFESGEYLHIRHAMAVLRATLQIFPAVNFMGRDMLGYIESISKDEPRQDLNLAAKALILPLKSREKSWVMPQAFRLNDPAKDKEARPSGDAPTSHAASVRPEDAKPDAEAPDIKPKTEARPNGTRKESVNGQEEGEIEEVKMEDAPTNDTSDVKADVTGNAPTARPPSSVPQDRYQESDKAGALSSATGSTATKAGTPTPSSVPHKPPPQEITRPRASNLPPKPENPSVAHAPPRDRSDRGFISRQNDSYGRLDRPGDIPPSRDRSPAGRGRGRTMDRETYYDYSYPSQGRGPPNRDERPPLRQPDMRQSREDLRNGGRRDTGPAPSIQSRPPDARTGPEMPMGPPSSTSHVDRSGYSNAAPPAPARTGQPSRFPPRSTQPPPSPVGTETTGVNPERLVLIEQQNAATREDGRPRPPRSQDGWANSDSPRGDVAIDRRSRDNVSGQGDWHEENGDYAPAGPRGNRYQPSASREDGFGFNAPPGRGVHDLRNSRPSRDMGPGQAMQESSYGRLNRPTDVPPSGPRQSNGVSSRGGRIFGVAHPHNDARPTEPSPSIQPTAQDVPSSFRGNRPLRRDAGPTFDRPQPPPPSSVAPTTPVSGPSTGGMHPSRAAQLGTPVAPIQPSQSTSRTAASPSAAPPSGPRGPNRPTSAASTGPPPTHGHPAVAPLAPATDRVRRDRQRSSINNMLQSNTAPESPAQGMSFRGASTRQSTAGPLSATPAETQAMVPPMEPPRRDYSRYDAPPQRPESQQDQFARSDYGNRMGNRGRHLEDERPRSHHSSRHSSRERRPDDRRYPTSDDQRGGRLPLDARGPRPDELPHQRQQPMMSGMPPGPGDYGSPRGHPDDLRRGPPRAGDMRPGRMNEGRRDGPPRPQPPTMPPEMRKRRHEEGPGPGAGPLDGSKRRRSGRDGE